MANLERRNTCRLVAIWTSTTPGGQIRNMEGRRRIRTGSPTCRRCRWRHDRDAVSPASLRPARGTACVHLPRRIDKKTDPADRSIYRNRNRVRGRWITTLLPAPVVHLEATGSTRGPAPLRHLLPQVLKRGCHAICKHKRTGVEYRNPCPLLPDEPQTAPSVRPDFHKP